MYKIQLTVFLPDSFLSETKDLKLKTSKVGIIGRALAVFNVDQVVIYKDTSKNQFDTYDGQDRNVLDGNFISKILKYMDTPQYLRKSVYPIQSDLKHVGILPPLRTPNHPVDEAELGDYRQGFTVKRNKKGTFVDIGMKELAFCKEQLTVNKVFSFKVTKIAKEVIVIPDEPDDIYWGYKTSYNQETLKNSLKSINPDFVLVTTKYGSQISSMFDDLSDEFKKSRNVAILFGSPYNGISEDLFKSIQTSSPNIVKVNSIPHQGTETVRTEEALISTLAILNMIYNG
jgi:predicted SPOUT superfamily RNA methylase MTH1